MAIKGPSPAVKPGFMTPPHQVDHGASGATPADISPEQHDVAMLGQTGHMATAGAGYTATVDAAHGPFRVALGDDFDRGF
jgi:hypothetical protein